MSKENNIKAAKDCLKSHIKFFESLLKHLNGTDEVMKGRAVWASWCLHRYINDRLIGEIEKAMQGRANDDEYDPRN
jgi:hypothetical protein